MCVILRISVKNNPKIYCGLGGVYFRVITLDSASQILLQFSVIFDLKQTVIYIYIYMAFTTEGFLEVAIESWPEWDLSPRPLNSVQTL